MLHFATHAVVDEERPELTGLALSQVDERVVASLWSVQDKATAELMESFYRFVLVDGQRPASALRHAQIALRSQARYPAPYFWAPFIFQGDWDGLSESSTAEDG